MVSGDADDRPVVREVDDGRVEHRDRVALGRRILRVPCGVGRLLVTEHERVAGVETFAHRRDARAKIADGIVRLRRRDRLQPDVLREPAQERRLADERPRHSVPLEERRHSSRPSPPFQRDHVEPLAVETSHRLARPRLCSTRCAFRLRNERQRPQDGMPVAEERIRVGHPLVRPARDPQHGLAAPDVVEPELEPVDRDQVATCYKAFGFGGVGDRVRPAGQPPAVVPALGRAQRRVREDVLLGDLLAAPGRLEDRAAGELLGAVAEHRPVRHPARRRRAGRRSRRHRVDRDWASPPPRFPCVRRGRRGHGRRARRGGRRRSDTRANLTLT